MPSDHENDYKSWACEFYDFARSSYSQDELFMIQCEIVGIVSFLSSESLSWRVNTKMNTKHTLIANTRIFPISEYFLFPLQIQAEKEIGNICMQAKTQITTEAIAFTSS